LPYGPLECVFTCVRVGEGVWCCVRVAVHVLTQGRKIHGCTARPPEQSEYNCWRSIINHNQSSTGTTMPSTKHCFVLPSKHIPVRHPSQAGILSNLLALAVRAQSRSKLQSTLSLGHHIKWHKVRIPCAPGTAIVLSPLLRHSGISAPGLLLVPL
jgi:hypothetical protein